MSRRSILWRVGVTAFIFINLAGAAYAAVMGELLHASVHVALLLAVYPATEFAARRRERNRPDVQLASTQIDSLQQSVDTLALNVERMGESQRFIDKLRAEKDETSPPKKEE